MSAESIVWRRQRKVIEEVHQIDQTWSNKGLTLLNSSCERSKKVEVKCQTDHLTSFAVMMSPDWVGQSKSQSKVLNILTYIFVSLSLLGLLITQVTYSLFPSLNREKSGQILMNLCCAMIFLYALFLIAAQASESIQLHLCYAVGALLHYATLASFAWMSVEAAHMYRQLVKVFGVFERFFLLKRCIFAWGLPAVIVVISLSIDNTNYRRNSTKLCLISVENEGLYYATYITPIALSLLFNLMVFFLVVRVIVRPRPGSPMCRPSIKPAQIRGIFTVITLLGLFYICGFFLQDRHMDETVRDVFAYIMVITTAPQGFAIFISRCLLSTEARLAWTHLYRTGKCKRKRGFIVTASKLSSEPITPTKPKTKQTSCDTATGTSPSSSVSSESQIKTDDLHVDFYEVINENVTAYSLPRYTQLKSSPQLSSSLMAISLPECHSRSAANKRGLIDPSMFDMDSEESPKKWTTHL